MSIFGSFWTWCRPRCYLIVLLLILKMCFKKIPRPFNKRSQFWIWFPRVDFFNSSLSCNSRLFNGLNIIFMHYNFGLIIIDTFIHVLHSGGLDVLIFYCAIMLVVNNVLIVWWIFLAMVHFGFYNVENKIYSMVLGVTTYLIVSTYLLSTF